MILVTGATGRIGSELVHALLSKRVPVRAMVRSLQKAKALQSSGIELVEGDLEKPESLDAVLQGIEKVFLISIEDPRLPELHGEFAAKAKRAGVHHLVRMSILVSRPDSPLALGQWHWSADKQVMESGVPFTILKPAYFMQNLLASAPMVKMKGILPGAMGDGRIGLIDVRDIAEVAAAVLTGDDHMDKTYPLTGAEAISLRDATAKLSQALGKDVKYLNLTPEDAKAGMISMGMSAQIAAAWVQLARMIAQGAADMVTDNVKSITGKEPRSFDQFAREFAGAFKSE